jgi:hypothetical protein
MNGRGNVNVVQQPSSQNGYTTIIRVDDPSAGSAAYRIVGYWQSYATGDVYRDNRGRDNRGRDNRDRDNGVRDNRGRGNGNNNGNRDDRNDRRNSNDVYTNGRANQSMLHWTGNVDGELEVRIQNGRISYRNLSGQQPTSIRATNGYMNVPRTDASVGVVQNQGRGSVSVVEQPSSRNGYTTVLRIRDPQGGYGYYDFDLMWQ